MRDAKNWRVGNIWQGFRGQYFETIIDLGKVQTVNTVQLGALQDTNAWIIFPPETSFFIGPQT